MNLECEKASIGCELLPPPPPSTDANRYVKRITLDHKPVERGNNFSWLNTIMFSPRGLLEALKAQFFSGNGNNGAQQRWIDNQDQVIKRWQQNQ